MYNIQNTAKNLLKNGISSSFVEEIADVTDEIRRLIPTGSSVAMGGSMSLKECGATELLRGGDYKFLDRDAQNADFFLASSNAVTENGELYNVDGIGNRVGAIACGPKHVILVCGVNKIVPDIDAAVRRVKEVAAPPNAKRLGRNTYCAHN
ncbi:MAG: lactate utilization protein, partial [Clostridia bacterium]